jgi:hypothetical protein
MKLPPQLETNSETPAIEPEKKIESSSRPENRSSATARAGKTSAISPPVT